MSGKKKMGRPRKPKGLEYFMSRTVCEGKCRVWTGFAIEGKVPKVEIGGKTVNVRREVWKEVFGELAPGLQVGISCGTLKCIEPACLIARTRKEAMAQAVFTAAGRASKKRAARDRAVLSMDIAREIRASGQPADELAAEFGVRPRQVRRIRTGEQWAEPNPWQGLGERREQARA